MAWIVGHTVKRCKKPVEDNDLGGSGGGYGGGYGNETTFDSAAGAGGDSSWGDNNPAVEVAPAAGDGW